MRTKLSGMKNFNKAKMWFLRGIAPTVYAIVVGTFIGIIIAFFCYCTGNVNQDTGLIIPGCGFWGGALVACIYATLCVWFILLHMISQVSSAIRGE